VLSVPLRSVRRFAIVRQHLSGVPKPNMLDVVRDLGCLQLDPTSAVAHSHLLVLWSRLGPTIAPSGTVCCGASAACSCTSPMPPRSCSQTTCRSIGCGCGGSARVIRRGRSVCVRSWTRTERCAAGSCGSSAPRRGPALRMPQREAVRRACQRSLRALGVATAREIREHFTRNVYADLAAVLRELERNTGTA
jgi:uncharacterized protein YcaQ